MPDMSNLKKSPALAGKRVVITRPEGQAAALRNALEAAGASVLELPLLSIEFAALAETKRDVLEEIGQYAWIVFTSPNGVEGFFRQFFETFRDIRSLGMARIACVGAGTAKGIEALRLQVDLVPEKAEGENLARALLAENNVENEKILVVTGNKNRDTLVTILTDEGRAIVDTLPVYETRENDVSGLDATAEFRRAGADAIVFASPSAVEAFVAQAGTLKLSKTARQPKTVAIGATTASMMRECGIPLSAQAAEPTPAALAAAVCAALK